MDFPDPDEEFECMHADELEYLRDLEEEDEFRNGDYAFPSDGNRKPVKTEDLATPLEPNEAEGKRKLDELFGDVKDVSSDEESIAVPAKKSCVSSISNEENDEMLMEKIISRRKMNMGIENGQSLEAQKQSEGCITRNVPPWPFVPTTNDDGKRVYVRLLSEDIFKQQVASVSTSGKYLTLLSEPFQALLSGAEEYLEKKKVESQARKPAVVASQQRNGVVGSSDLWVEKYRPRSYMDLLSDEGTNRTLLKWLKLWDHAVFKTEIKKPRVNKEEKKFKKDNQDMKFKKDNQAEFIEEVDEAGYPVKKLVLLCGPPGLGKTTLAHVVAEHAGYNVVEINASDDRSPEAFRNKLEAATSMQAVVGSSPRPNCLVMDEIDGAPAPAIDVLLKVAGAKESAKSKEKKGGRKHAVLKRPIICICNDLYTPALRLLRQQALIIHFGSTANSRLACRMMEISREQGIKTDMGAIMSLCQKMQNDIRSCISFLHLFKVQNRPLRMIDVQKTTVGLKDMQKSAFDVWQEIFKIHKEKVGSMLKDHNFSLSAVQSPLLRFSENSLKYRMVRVMRAVQSFGDYERLSQGVFENYLSVKQKESALREVAVGAEGFIFFDIINNEVRSQQSYFLLPYLPFYFVKWHFLFAENSWPKLVYPRSGFEANTRFNNFNQTMNTVMEGLLPKVRCHNSRMCMYLDVLPFLLAIISPPLRSVSMELYNQREKANFSHLVRVMIDYNLNYVQERTAEGSYVYNLDPNVEHFVIFPGLKAPFQLPYNTKQIIAREVKMERMKQFEQVPLSQSAPLKSSQPANHLQKLTPRAIKDVSHKVAKDFFGRAVAVDSKLEKRNMSTFIKSDIWYHFKEGYTNAVRRRVRIKDFM
ncbi:chromosome transmission fidelity protein 18 homolog [Ischnura elegans]|uniref:chromosome transmission fidelity protein 18 homolog n=1 Tax=Ischnura elegans TaxID=197161 RepID=UPI001ED874D4|nr:chromosome transmission fidelity protein 18 homolog [Ischnura elegans]